MNQNTSLNPSVKRKRGEITLEDIFNIIKRRRNILFITVILALLFAFLYNLIKQPVYEASVLLKKEILGPKNVASQVRDFVFLQSQDEIETDMELVKTRDVLNRVILDLNLNLYIKSIEIPDGTTFDVNKSYLEFITQNKKSSEISKYLPKITDLKTIPTKNEIAYSLQKIDSSKFELVQAKNDSLRYLSDSLHQISSPHLSFKVDWKNVNWGSKFNFVIKNHNEAFEDLFKNLSVDHRVKTNLFEITAKSFSPVAAKIIANTVADKFRERRIEKQRENIRYSYKFVDQQLNLIAEKLKKAENKLTQFKSSHQILSIDASSKRIIEFVSNLETEKLKNDLALAEYSKKASDMGSELDMKGYIDQTFLTPERIQPTDSPFSKLLSQLSDLQLKKLELLQKRTESHPDVITLTHKINMIKRDLTKFNKNTLTAYTILINALKIKQNKIDALIEKYMNKIENLPAQENKLADLLREKGVYEKMFTLLLDKREEMRIAELSKLQDVIILDYAEEPYKPILPNKKLNYLVALLFGFVLGTFGMFLFEFNDKKMSDIYEIERDYSFPILSVIPPYTKEIKSRLADTSMVSKRFVTLIENAYNYKEAYRILETKVSSCFSSQDRNHLMITSAEEDSGKTTVAANLALTMAHSDKKVLLIDCDIRKPQIAELFGMDKYIPGLINYLQGETDTPNIYKPVKITGHSNTLMNIDILPTGSYTNVSGEILGSDRMKEMLEQLDYYDYILFDTPPITRVADALSLGKIVKTALLVIRPGVTLKESATWALSELRAANIKLCGSVVNDCEVKKSTPRYHYGYGQ